MSVQRELQIKTKRRQGIVGHSGSSGLRRPVTPVEVWETDPLRDLG